MRFDLYVKNNLSNFLDSSTLEQTEKRGILSLPRSFWQKEIKNGNILLNKKTAKCSTGIDNVKNFNVSFKWKNIQKKWRTFYQEKLLPYPLPLEIIKKYSSVVAINKPAGIIVYPLYPLPSHSPREISLVEGFYAKYPKKLNVVHRLDKETSGILLLALSKKSAVYMKKLFKKRRVKKTYFALVEGNFPAKHFLLSGLIGKNKKKPLLRSIDNLKIVAGQKTTHYRNKSIILNPKNSLTKGEKITCGHWDALKKEKNAILRQWIGLTESALSANALAEFKKGEPIFSFLKLAPWTGRTHQLRVQLSAAGCPIVGDRLYSKSIYLKTCLAISFTLIKSNG